MGKSAIEDARRGNYFWLPPDRITIIGIDTKDGSEHPLWVDKDDERYRIDPIFVDDLILHGVIHPVKIVKIGDDFVAVVGRRRVLHARAAVKLQKANRDSVLLEVPCTVVKDSTRILMGMMTAENEHRADEGIRTKAERAARMIRVGGMDEAEVATSFDKTPNTIRTWLRLLEADPKIHKAVDQGILSESAAAKLAALPVKEQAEAVAEAVAESKATGGKVSQHHARAIANKRSGRSENVGLNSRKVLKRLRDEYTDGDDQAKGDDGEYAAGVRDALNLVLGDKPVAGKLGKDAKKFARKIDAAAAKESA